MQTLKDKAINYESKELANISELSVVNVNIQTREEQRERKDGSIYIITIATIDGVDYRVPDSVLKQLQTQLKENPKMENFRVIKTGKDMNTTYTVVPK